MVPNSNARSVWCVLETKISCLQHLIGKSYTKNEIYTFTSSLLLNGHSSEMLLTTSEKQHVTLLPGFLEIPVLLALYFFNY